MKFPPAMKSLIFQCVAYKSDKRPKVREVLKEVKTVMVNNSIYNSALQDFELLRAAGQGNLGQVERLLNQGARIHVQSGSDGEGVLHKAATSGNEDLLRILLNKGLRVSQKAANGYTPLHCAAAKGLDNVVELFMTHGKQAADAVGIIDNQGWTVFHTAAACGSNSVIEKLLAGCGKKGWIDHRTTGEDLTMLHIAAMNGHVEIVHYLLKEGAAIEATMNGGGTALHVAAKENQIPILRILLAKKAKFDGEQLRPRIPIWKTLVGSGVKSDGTQSRKHKTKRTALHDAASNGHLEAVTALLDYGENIEAKNDEGQTAFHSAAANGHDQVIKLLAKEQANIHATVTKSERTALHCASEAGHESTVEALLGLGLGVNARMNEGETALQRAVLKGNRAVMKVLLKHGAAVDIVGPNYVTALHYAAEFDRVEMVQDLLGTSPSVKLIEARSGTGETALLVAARRRSLEVVQELISRKANIKAKDKEGNTALHLACKAGSRDVVQFLLENGAERNAENDGKKKPLDLITDKRGRSLSEKYEDVLRILRTEP